MTYKYFIPPAEQKNKPNQTQFKPKTNPISKKPEMNVNIYYKREYSNKIAFWRNQNKPNSNLVLSGVEWANFRKAKNGLKIACQKIRPHPKIS